MIDAPDYICSSIALQAFCCDWFDAPCFAFVILTVENDPLCLAFSDAFSPIPFLCFLFGCRFF